MSPDAPWGTVGAFDMLDLLTMLVHVLRLCAWALAAAMAAPGAVRLATGRSGANWRVALDFGMAAFLAVAVLSASYAMQALVFYDDPPMGEGMARLLLALCSLATAGLTLFAIAAANRARSTP